MSELGNVFEVKANEDIIIRQNDTYYVFKPKEILSGMDMDTKFIALRRGKPFKRGVKMMNSKGSGKHESRFNPTI